MSDGKVGHREEMKLTLLIGLSGYLHQKNLSLKKKILFPIVVTASKLKLGLQVDVRLLSGSDEGWRLSGHP